MKHTLKLTTPSDRVIVMTRTFNAPRRLVFDAFTKPELLKRWFGAIGGFELVVCEVATKPGQKYRYVWQGPDGSRMGLGGVCQEFVAPERMKATGKFEESWYPGEELSTTTFVEHEGQTTVTMHVEYNSKETRDMVLKSPMEMGVGAGYDMLETLLKGE